MANKIYLDSSDNITFVDGVQTDARTLTQLVAPEKANGVELEEIGTATYDDIQNWINNIQSAGYVSGGTITATSPSDGTIAISAIKGFLKITDSDIGVTKSFDLAGTASFALTNNQSNYIYVDYNDGTPKFNVTTTRSDIELNRQFTLGRVYRKDNETHIVNSGAFLTNHVRNTHERLVAVRGFERATGGVTSETGERYLYVTAGTFYLGQNKATTSLVDTSGTDTFTRYYHTAGVWTSDTKSQIAEGGAGFYKYDNGTDLVNLSNNKYGVFWVFIHFDGDLHVIVGRGDYTLAEAQGANVPAIPNGVNDFATLIAKIILLEDGTNFTSVETAYEQFFPYSRAVNHNDLGLIQGGGADDYYHLTNAQLTDASKNTIILTPAGAVFPATGIPALTQINGTYHSYFVADFDKDTDEKCDWHFTIPANWGAGNITARIKYIANATTGDVMWVIGYKGISETESIDQALTDEAFSADTVDGTANRLCIASKTFALTGITAGEWVILRLTRDADHASDTLAVDARLLEVVIEWTI